MSTSFPLSTRRRGGSRTSRPTGIECTTLYVRVHDAMRSDGRLPEDLGVEMQQRKVMRAAV